MNPFTGIDAKPFCGKVYFKTKNLDFRFFPEQNNSLERNKICEPFLLDQRKLSLHLPQRDLFFARKEEKPQRGIESSPLRLSCFARLFFFTSAAADKKEK